MSENKKNYEGSKSDLGEGRSKYHEPPFAAKRGTTWRM